MTAPVSVADIMSRRVIVLSEEDNLSQVATQLARLHFHHLPVVDDGKLVGMLSQRDLLRNTVSGVDQSAVARTREERFLESTFVRDIMRSDVVTARTGDSISSAARSMLDARVGALPVVDEAGTLLGIVKEHDILRYVASRELLQAS
jgi:CBS domain-containing membrane protein